MQQYNTKRYGDDTKIRICKSKQNLSDLQRKGHERNWFGICIPEKIANAEL
jgi:hypothetical protein